MSTFKAVKYEIKEECPNYEIVVMKTETCGSDECSFITPIKQEIAQDYCPGEQEICFQYNDNFVKSENPEESWHKIEFFKEESCEIANYVVKPETNAADNWFYCDHCPYRFSKQVYLDGHTSCHHSDKYLAKNTKFSTSVFENNPEPGKRFKCRHCSYESHKQVSVRKHTIMVHKVQNLVCPICDVAFNSTRNLGLHRAEHALNDVGKWHECGQCSGKFPAESSLTKHILNTHIMSKRFKCNYCSYKNEFKHALKSHIARKHKEQQLLCEKCGFTTKNCASLRSHDKKHSLEDSEWFNRDHCNSSFDEHLSAAHCESENKPTNPLHKFSAKII